MGEYGSSGAGSGSFETDWELLAIFSSLAMLQFGAGILLDVLCVIDSSAKKIDHGTIRILTVCISKGSLVLHFKLQEAEVTLNIKMNG